uniref:tripartite tricarboxylate transporter permease n=1 Tax=Arsukibacterium sp. TaxID=1977258 RepID=UPI002FDA5EE5
MLEHLLDSAVQLLAFWPLMAIAGGLIIGILAGAMPGLSPSMAVALLVPFTYGMSPILALILLVAIYIGANYGGSITAITVNTPGTASAVVTAIDGYALTRQGQAASALGISIVSSAVAGVIGTLVLIFFSVPLAGIAVKFHPAEYFALAIFGLATVSSLAGKNSLKAFITAVLGLLISTLGTDPISGADRFSFNISALSDGFLLIPALIGLFALSEVFYSIEKRDFKQPTPVTAVAGWPKFTQYWKLKWVTLRSALIGTLIGIFPGAGAVIASFISYDIAKKYSSTPEQFGHGSHEGVAAAEAAN